MLKKFSAIFLCLMMLGSFVACDSDAPPTNPNQNESTDDNNGADDNNQSNNENNDENNDENNNEEGNQEIEIPEWLKVGSFNIAHTYDNDVYLAGGGLVANQEKMAEAILKEDFDIFGLQEVDVNRSSSSNKKFGVKRDQPKYIAQYLTEKTGVQHYYCFGAGLIGTGVDKEYVNEYGYDAGASLYGVAIISKYPILSYRAVPLGFHEGYDANDISTYLMNGYERRVLLIADIQVGDQVFTLINTHFDLKQDARRQSVLALEAELKTITNPVAFMGDLNATYSSTEIQYITNNLLTPTTSLNNTPPTFPSDNPKNKIDWIFVSEDIEFGEFTVSQTTASDHCPVWVNIKLPKKESTS